MSNTHKTLTFLTVAMLVINILLLAFIFVGKGRKHRHHDDDDHHGRDRERFESHITSRLGLDEEQREEFESLSRQHRDRYWELTQNIFERKRQINTAIANDDEAQGRVLLAEIDSLHRVREQNYFAHTRAIFALCDEDQKQALLETLNRVGDDYRKKRRSRGRGR